MEGIGFIILLIVMGIMSVIQKFRERQEAERQRDQRRHVRERRAGENGDADHPVRTARPKEAERPAGRRMLEELFGVELVAEESAEEEEPEWEPAPPPLRRELPSEYQQRREPGTRQATAREQAAQRPRVPTQPSTARPQRQRPARSPADMMGWDRSRNRARDMAEERKRQEQEAERRQEEARRRRQQIEAQRRQREDIVQPVERTGSARARVFRDRKQLRQAIVLKEVLDRPRGIKELDDFSWT